MCIPSLQSLPPSLYPSLPPGHHRAQSWVPCAVPQLPAAAAKSLQSCPILCNPTNGSPLAPPSMGFSRQEYWSGVPLPSPQLPASYLIYSWWLNTHGLPWLLSGKESACKCKRCLFDPWLGKISGEGNGSSLQYSCLGNAMDRGAWWALVHWVSKIMDTA